MPEPDPPAARTVLDRALDWVERAGNRIPHPFWLFVGLFGLVAAGSELAARLGVEAVGRDGVAAPVQSLLSAEGLRWFVLGMVSNYAHFEPLGLVLVMLMGVAIAEGSGLIEIVMRAVALAVPRGLVVPVLFMLAACGNVGSDAGVVVIPPLAAVVFRALGRSPIAGLLVGYVGASAGFTANLLPAGTDVIAASLTNEASGGHPEVNVLANWYFMAVSVPFLALVGTAVDRWIVGPRIERASAQAGAPVPDPSPPSPTQRRAMLAALLAVALVGALWLSALVLPGGPLRSPDPDPAQFWRSPFFKGLIPILFSLFATAGVVYGRLAGTLARADDVVAWMTQAMGRMAGYLVLVLAIAQFVAAFQFTRLDAMIAGVGADLLRGLGFASAPVPFLLAFITIVAIANLFMGSASAKWAIFAPVFVPVFLQLGFHPAFTQLLYRLGDSITNCVSPLYPYFPLLLGWVAAEDPERARVGTVLSWLVPYAAVLFVAWLALFLVWYAAGWPVGPDAPQRWLAGAPP